MAVFFLEIFQTRKQPTKQLESSDSLLASANQRSDNKY